jgi:hypothetical protein
MMRTIGFSAALAFATIALPSAGNAAKPVTITANGTYVLVEVNNPPDMKFMGTTMPGSMTLARYDPVNGDIRGGYKAQATALPKNGLVRVLIGLKTKALAKTKTSRLYLVEIVPDTWVIEGASGTSYSLGSLTFTAKQGDIIDLGVVVPRVDLAEGEEQKSVNAGAVAKMMLVPFARMPEPKKNKLDMRARTAGDLPLPKMFEGRTLTVPQLNYGATFGNYAGGLINRIDGRAGRGRASDVAVPAALPTVPVTATTPAPSPN